MNICALFEAGKPGFNCHSERPEGAKNPSERGWQPGVTGKRTSITDTDTVREYMEQQMPGFVHLQGSRVINEPTYSNSTCADETVLKYFFQVLGKDSPCVEIKIYPSDTSETSITITEHWVSLGCPWWLKGL